MNKTIRNIVFYKFWDPTREESMQQACIFYSDGTAKNVLYEEGKKLANEIAKQEQIKTKAEFVSMINTKRVYALTGKEFERRFNEFLGKGAVLVPDSSVKPAVIAPSSDNKTVTSPAIKKENPEPKKTIIIPPQTTNSGELVKNGDRIKYPYAEADSISAKPKKTRKNKKNKKSKNKKGLFKRMWVKVTAFVLAAAMFFTGGYLLGRNTKSGNITNNNIISESNNEIPPQDQAFLNLLEKSTNSDQKATMLHQSQSLDIFNRDFANVYLEEGNDIKASLTWDEMIALNLAYNTYSKDQIRIMFNGAEVDSAALSSNYKNAILQLMGAYVISTRENPVNSQKFLTNPEQKAFVEKYNNLFLTMKETTGEEQIAAINAFYTELYKDFPISEEVREEGISHADARKQIEPYKAAVTPMVMAAEVMFQNVSDVDHTLSDKAVAYFNDLGLCNVVEEQFKRAETITLAAETDESQPLYTEFRDAKITELIYEGNYPTDDAHRDLSKLTAFQNCVNKHSETTNQFTSGTTTSKSTPSTSTSTTEETKTIVTNDKDTAVSQAGSTAVKEAETKVDEELAAQNEAAKNNAQEEAEKKSQTAKEEVAKDAADMQTKIDEANDKINKGETVNEEDFKDHEVDFNDEFEDDNGNLSDSVINITTDETGVKTENDLPDPNQTGAIFDEFASTNNVAEPASGTSTEVETSPVEDSEIYEYEEPYNNMTNEEIVDAYIASLEGQGETDSAKVYQK